MLRYTTVSGIPVADLIPKDRLEAIVKRTREGGAEVIRLTQITLPVCSTECLCMPHLSRSVPLTGRTTARTTT